jgi:hypothetical protein
VADVGAQRTVTLRFGSDPRTETTVIPYVVPDDVLIR